MTALYAAINTKHFYDPSLMCISLLLIEAGADVNLKDKVSPDNDLCKCWMLIH